MFKTVSETWPTLTSAIDNSIDNNDNDKKTTRDYFFVNCPTDHKVRKIKMFPDIVLTISFTNCHRIPKDILISKCFKTSRKQLVCYLPRIALLVAQQIKGLKPWRIKSVFKNVPMPCDEKIKTVIIES